MGFLIICRANSANIIGQNYFQLIIIVNRCFYFFQNCHQGVLTSNFSFILFEGVFSFLISTIIDFISSLDLSTSFNLSILSLLNLKVIGRELESSSVLNVSLYSVIPLFYTISFATVSSAK